MMNQPAPVEGSARRLLRTGLALVLAWVVAFCAVCQRKEVQNTVAEEQPAKGGQLRVLSEPPGRLDPIAVDEVYEAAVVHQIYEGLLSLDAGLRLRPGLASSWTISKDERVYTFSIRPELHFHDGTPLSAEDVAFSLQRCLAPDDDVECMAQSYLAHIRGGAAFREGRSRSIEGIRVLDELTLAIELEEPLSIFLNVLAMDQTVVVSRGSVESCGTGGLDERPNGCGPFRFVRRNDDGGIVLARFDSYWRAPAWLDTLIYQPIPESMGISEQEALSLGRVDLATLRMGDIPKAQEAGLAVYRSPELSVAFLGLRCDQPPLDIPQVRRAVLLALDRQRLQQIDPARLVPVHGLLPPGMPGRDPVDRMPERDLQAASQLLVDAGHPEGEGLEPIVINAVGGGRIEQMIEVIEEGIRETGLDARTELMDWRQLDSLAVGGHLQAFLMSWVADLPDAYTYLRSLVHSEGESNLFGYASAEADSLLDLGQRLPTGPQRSRTFLQLQEVILTDAPFVPLFHSSMAYSWRPLVRGLSIGPCGISVVDMTRVYLREPAEEPLHGRAQ